jgi:hypothetical protein
MQQQFLQKRVLENKGLPRLSLFYIGAGGSEVETAGELRQHSLRIARASNLHERELGRC